MSDAPAEIEFLTIEVVLALHAGEGFLEPEFVRARERHRGHREPRASHWGHGQRANGIESWMKFLRGATGAYLAQLGARDVASLFTSPALTA